MKSPLCWVLGLFASILSVNQADASTHYYRNLLVGERASGMGGGFTAIADDPSGIYYNPAGIAYSMENYFSLSVNTLQFATQRYDKVVAGQNYQLSSNSFVPSFFGFTQNVWKGKLGVAIVVEDSDLYDQDDVLSNITSDNGFPNTLSRRYYNERMVYLFGPAYSMEVHPKVTVGFSLFGVFQRQKALDMQFIQYNPVPTGNWYNLNQFLTRNAFGLQPKLGVIFAPLPKWSLGFTMTRKFHLTGSGKAKSIVSNTDNNGLPVTPNGDAQHDLTIERSDNVTSRIMENFQFTLGVAYFASRTFLVTSDFDLYTPDSKFLDHPVNLTWNYSLGTEWYAHPRFPVRLGFFTNNANTPSVSGSAVNQAPHVNMYGGSFGLSLLSPGSSLTLSTSYAMGKGKGQIIGNSTTTQDVTQSSLTFYLSGSYQM